MSSFLSRLRLPLIALLLLPASAHALDVLFIGNSFTYGYNNYNHAAVTDLQGKHYGGVPALFKKFADEKGPADVNVSLVAEAGESLTGHYANRTHLFDKSWDVVVLQDHSVRPLTSFTGSGDDVGAFRLAISRLATFFRVRNPNVKIFLYETWARPGLVIGNYYPDLASMQTELRNSYSNAATDYNLQGWAPVGDAFLAAVEQGFGWDPSSGQAAAAGQINLWDTDNYHAGRYGAYLAALVLYGKILEKDTRSLETGAGTAVVGFSIDPAHAEQLQELAWSFTHTGISQHPQSQSVFPGDEASFSVSGGGQSPTYQWRHNGTPIPGATSKVFEIAAVSAGDTGRYDVIVTDAANEVYVSSPAALTFGDQTIQRRFLIDLGSSGTVYETASPDGASRHWNNLTGSTSGSGLATLLDTSGTPHSSAKLAVTDGFSGLNQSGNDANTPYPSTAQIDSFYVTGTSASSGPYLGQVTFTGLHPGARYSLTLFGSRSGSGTRVSRYTVPGLSPVYLNAMNNTIKTAPLGPITIGSTGSLSLNVEPYNSVGTLQEYAYLGVIELLEERPVCSAFMTWTGLSGLTADLASPTNDPDADGIPNLLEYALGSNPLGHAEPGSTAQPVLSTESVGGSTYLSLQVPKNPDALGVDYVVETSSDLQNWTSGEAYTTVVAETPTLLTVRDNTPATTNTRRFLRVRVLLTE